MAVNADTIRPDAVAFLLAFVIALALGPRVIAGLRVLKFGQNINTDAPERHLQKQGTPTMGGVLFVLATVLSLVLVLAFARSLPGASLVAVVCVFVAHAALGFVDDYRKAKRGKSLGLKAREKLAGQVVIALAFVIWRSLTAQPNFTTVITLWRGHPIDLGYAYYVLVVLLMVGLSNATNLTDGLDGLASGLAILTALGLAWTVYPGDPRLPLFACALAGACLGFLWYNAHPAKVFMGDTGSLALGASLTALAVVGKQEVLLVIFMLVFLMEMFSVIIQVTSFKRTGRRVFKMTPIHHHFELIGWDETQVVMRFWILGALALALGLLCAPYLSVWMVPR